MAEVGQAPADLGADVALGGQRQDDVAVGLGQGAGAVGHDPLEHVGGVALQPRGERGADVERQQPVVVDEGEHPVPLVHHPGPPVGPVALGRDALVPVVRRRRRRLPGHLLGPGVLPWRLVEVPVDDESDAHPR